MLRGFYIASNGLLNQQRVLNTISNNVANAQTPGYKSDTSVQNTFKRELIRLNQGRRNQTGAIEYKYIEKSYTQLTQGSFEFTERPLDIAIEGPVYFNIQGKDGNQYLSRNGQFSLDNEGYLELAGSGRVLGGNGPIYIGTSDFAVNDKGDIYIDGQYSDSLQLTYVSDNSNVNKKGDNLFELAEGAETNPPDDMEYSIIQGAFERSNIDMATEMTKAMAAQRSFESMAQALKMVDSINEKAANVLGKV